MNPRAFRLMITMMVCLGIFKAATVVSNADSLPGVEYRVCQSEAGWSKWSRNSETSGDIASGKKMEAIKIILTDTIDANVNYKVYVASKGWSELASNGVTVGGTEGIQAIKVALTGEVAADYTIKYRVHTVGGNWSEWAKGPAVAGDVSGTTPIDGMEVVLVDSSGQSVVTDAQDYSKELPTQEGQAITSVQETAVDRGERPSTQDTTVPSGEVPVIQDTTVSQGGEPGTQDVITIIGGEPGTQDTEVPSGEVPVIQDTVPGGEVPVIQDTVPSEEVPVIQDTVPEGTTPATNPEADRAAKNIEKIVKIAKEEKGYTQPEDGVTKYGNWWANKVSDDAFRDAKWSSMFLAWCGNQAGLTDEQYGYYACSQYWKNWFVNKSAYHVPSGYTPKVGDIIFMDYDNDGESNHNGIVIDVTADKVITIEGNVAGVTEQCEYAFNDKKILGYGTPFYGLDPTTQPVQPVQPEQPAPEQPEGTEPGKEETGNVGTPGTLEKLSTPLEGIDVSEFNSINSWSSIAQNVDFAYIRVGGRSTAGSIFKDKKFDTNIKEATNNGVKVGVYFYTQAITVAEAEEEAAYVLDKVKGYNLTYPIAVDSEKSPSGARTDKLSKAKRTEIIKAFMDKITAAGYKAQLYSGKYFMYDHFNMDDMAGRDVWVAQYNNSRAKTPITDFKYPYNVWQYSNQGKVSGISGNTDKNLCYVKY